MVKVSGQNHLARRIRTLPEGAYNVQVPAIPEICTYGETLEEARQMAQDAISLFPRKRRDSPG